MYNNTEAFVHVFGSFLFLIFQNALLPPWQQLGNIVWLALRVTVL